MPAIDHLGWAVRSIETSRPHFEAGLGLGFQSDERFAEVRVAFFGAGPTRVELLEPLTPESEIGRFISRRGEGLHHPKRERKPDDPKKNTPKSALET